MPYKDGESVVVGGAGVVMVDEELPNRPPNQFRTLLKNPGLGVVAGASVVIPPPNSDLKVTDKNSAFTA